MKLTRRFVLPASVFPLLLALLPCRSMAMPATTVKVADTSNLVPANGEELFVGASFNTDAAFKGMRGAGVSVGFKFEKSFFLDASFHYYRFPYNAVKIEFLGLDQNPFIEGTELKRDRSSAQSTMFTAGPGIGVMYKLFGSKRWVEMARFGLSYLRYSEADAAFIGGAGHFQASLGYRLDPVLITLGAGWNLGYMTRDSDPSGINHNNFLPIQWWSFQLAALLWVY